MEPIKISLLLFFTFLASGCESMLDALLYDSPSKTEACIASHRYNEIADRSAQYLSESQTHESGAFWSEDERFYRGLAEEDCKGEKL